MVRRCLTENPNFECDSITGCLSSGCFPFKPEKKKKEITKLESYVQW